MQTMEAGHEFKHNLSEESWSKIIKVAKIVEPFMNFQKFLEGQKYVTSSFLPFIIFKIRNGLMEVIASEDDEVSVTLATDLLGDFNGRWGDGSMVLLENSVSA